MTPTAGINTDSIAEAQRGYRRLNSWFLFFVALIPLGVVLPCLLSIAAYRIWGSDVSAPIALSALLWPVAGVAGALLLRGARARARRSLALAKLADSFNLRFTRRPALEKYDFLKQFSFIAGSHAQSAANLLEGQAGRWPLLALDYEYSFHWGSVTEIGAQTMAVLLSGFERLPPLAVVPIGTMGKIENFFLGKRNAIPFPHQPQFNRQFAVVGDASAAACIRRPLIDLLLADRLLTLLVENGRLLVFRRLTYIKAEDYQAFLAQAHRVAELLA